MKRKACFSVFKISLFFLLTLLLLSFLLISGCSPISNLLFGPSGSIEVTTYPSGAKIFLNDKDSGHVTPYTILNLTKGTYEVMVILDDISYTETVIVYSNNTTSVYKDLLPRLKKIIVQPSYMNLEEGESQTIDSITAYYFDSVSTVLPLSDCSYSSSSNHATVNSIGTITGVSEGSATITVSYTNVEITKTDTVNVTVASVNPIVYRALCVGVGDYKNLPPPPDGDLNGPPYDVNRIIQVLSECKFGSYEVGFSLIESLKDLNATKEAIINGIVSTFSGADDNDISYFYFSGHGYCDLITYIAYFCPSDDDGTLNSLISVNELENALSAIPGTKVVLLDCCQSGGFIGKNKRGNDFNNDNLKSFNDSIVNSFLMGQSKDLLTTNQYKVLTSCHFYQACMESSPHPTDNDPFGYFTAALCEGCGYSDGNYYADSDNNNKVSLSEAMEYIEFLVPIYEILYDDVDNRQDAQIYPSGSNFTIVEH